MYLDNPALPVRFSSKDAVVKLRETLKKKGWAVSKPECTKIIYRPFWIFYYEIFSSKKNGEVKHLSSGNMLLDAQNNTFTETEAIDLGNTTNTLEKPEFKIEIEVQKPSLRKEGAEKIAKLNLASKFKTSVDNIALTNLKMLYFPIWNAKVELDEKTHNFLLNASTGKMIGSTQTPQKPQSVSEIAGETLSELKDPSAWITYTKEIISDAINFFSKSIWRIVILILIIAIILFYLY